MSSKSSESESRRQHRRLAAEIKTTLRELGTQLSLLNHQVGSRVALKAVDLECFDLVTRDGPLGPKVLARRAGLHPATVTGVLDRLERGGWVVRERDETDRRAVVVRALRERNAELFQVYAGMNASMDELLADYGPAELELVADFLRRTSAAGRDATDDLADG